MVDIVTNDNNKDTFWIPINRYILDTFKDANNYTKSFNRYHININQIKESNVLIELSAIYDDIIIEFENFLTISCEESAGFKKYRIENLNKAQIDHYNIYFNVTNTEDQNAKANANYMIRYYYSTINNEYKYYFNETVEKNVTETNDKEANITLFLNRIKVKAENNKEIDFENSFIEFYIYGILYRNNQNSKEIINTTSRLIEHNELAKNETYLLYGFQEKWNLSFNNFKKDYNYNCYLQLRVNALTSKSLFDEKFLAFKANVDLTDIKKNKAKIWIIIGSILGAIVIALIVFFIVKFVKLRKKNANLKLEMLNMAFSNNVQKNVLYNENKISKNDSDYETTFI